MTTRQKRNKRWMGSPFFLPSYLDDLLEGPVPLLAPRHRPRLVDVLHEARLPVVGQKLLPVRPRSLLRLRGVDVALLIRSRVGGGGRSRRREHLDGARQLGAALPLLARDASLRLFCGVDGGALGRGLFGGLS